MTQLLSRHQAPTSFNLSRKDEQALAQTELYNHLATQAQTIAPEPLTTVEINSQHYEIYSAKWLVAYICYDHSEYVTQPWVVMVAGEEIFRHNTQARCFRYIEWHYKDGNLNPQPSADVPEVPFISEVCFYDQEALINAELIATITYNHDNHQIPYWQVIVNDMEIFRDVTPARCHSYIKQQYQAGLLPVQEPFEEPCSTGNEIMVQIAQACENFGLELLDGGNIYRDNEKLGQVGFSTGWWLIDKSGERLLCDSALDAVWMLQIDKNLPTTNEYLQYRLLEQMSSTELQQLFETTALVAA